MKYPILQSGFLSFTDKDLTAPPPPSKLDMSFVLNKSHLANTNLYFYIHTLDDLIKEYFIDPNVLKNFEFREKILSLAKKAFACKNIVDWINLQLKEGKISDLHIKFLIETIDFVSGEPRKITNVQWNNLLTPCYEHKKFNFDPSEYISKKIKYTLGQTKPTGVIETELSNFLSKWVSNTHGFEDLLISLYVIFGKTSGVTDIGNKSTGF